MAQLARHVGERGHRISYRLWPWSESMLLVAPRPFQHVTSDVADVQGFRIRHPSARCVRHINQTNAGRATTTVDGPSRGAKDVADSTVFISRWVRDYYCERWFDPARPPTVIHNGANPKVFYPSASAWDHTQGPW